MLQKVVFLIHLHFKDVQGVTFTDKLIFFISKNK